MAMKFNTAIAALMTLTNEIYENGSLTREEFEIFLKLLCPFAPHITEEIFQSLGNTTLLSLSPWPTYDESKTVDACVEIVMQINGKLRGTLTIAKDADKDTVLQAVKADAKIAEAIAGKTVVKEIFVPNKLVNLVIK